MSKFKVESIFVVAILAICLALKLPSIIMDVLSGMLHERWFLVRQIVLIMLGGCFMWLVYRLMILASAEQLKLREKNGVLDSWTDNYSDMNSMEKSVLLDQLFALRKADREREIKLLEKLDWMTEQLLTLNSGDYLAHMAFDYFVLNIPYYQEIYRINDHSMSLSRMALVNRLDMGSTFTTRLVEALK